MDRCEKIHTGALRVLFALDFLGHQLVVSVGRSLCGDEGGGITGSGGAGLLVVCGSHGKVPPICQVCRCAWSVSGEGCMGCW